MTEWIIKYRSSIGFFCVIVLLFLSKPSPLSISIGFILMMAGVAFRAWAAGHIDKNRKLAREGPYALTRNPLYFGNLILGTGVAVSGNNACAYSIFAFYYLFFFTFLILVEKKRMQGKFGSEYNEWAELTNLFFPKLKRSGSAHFNISQYIGNREYRVFFFTLLVLAAFVLKYLFDIDFIFSNH